MSDKGYVEVDVQTVLETEEAVLFDDGNIEFWVPISLMTDWPDIGDLGIAYIEEWFAIKEGLI